MGELPTACPRCGSTEIHFRKSRWDWLCDDCERKWTPAAPADPSPPSAPRARLFLGYGRRDAEDMADRLDQDLSLFGYEVWRDKRKIRSGTDFLREIEDGLRNTQVVVALLSPHAVRESGNPDSHDDEASANLEGPPSFRNDDFPSRPRLPGPVPTTDSTGCLTPGAINDRNRSGPASGGLPERKARESIGVA